MFIQDTYEQGESITIEVQTRNPSTETLADVSSVSLDIIGSDGDELVSDGAMVKSSTGVYQYYLSLASDTTIDKYHIIVTINNSGYINYEHSYFTVIGV